MIKTAIAALGLMLASAAQATTSCVDAVHAPLEGQSDMALPAGFGACHTGALIAHDGTKIWRCKVRPGFEDKVGATYLVVIEQGGRIIATERDEMEQGPLDAMRWYEVDFDRDGTHENVIARRVMETPAHQIQQWRVSIHSADWGKVITSFDGVEDFGPDAIFRDSPDEGCLILQTRYEALPGEGEQLALKGSLWAIVDGQPVALAEEPEPRVLDAAFIAERQQAPYPDDYMRTPFRWLYGRGHEAEQPQHPRMMKPLPNCSARSAAMSCWARRAANRWATIWPMLSRSMPAPRWKGWAAIPRQRRPSSRKRARLPPITAQAISHAGASISTCRMPRTLRALPPAPPPPRKLRKISARLWSPR